MINLVQQTNEHDSHLACLAMLLGKNLKTIDLLIVFLGSALSKSNRPKIVEILDELGIQFECPTTYGHKLDKEFIYIYYVPNLNLYVDADDYVWDCILVEGNEDSYTIYDSNAGRTGKLFYANMVDAVIAGEENARPLSYYKILARINKQHLMECREETHDKNCAKFFSNRL
jgi:hypothetical protein